MTALSFFGLFAVTAILVCYAFEDRSPWFILAFAIACWMGSAYGFLQGAWPFGVVEAVWASSPSAAGGRRDTGQPSLESDTAASRSRRAFTQSDSEAGLFEYVISWLVTRPSPRFRRTRAAADRPAGRYSGARPSDGKPRRSCSQAKDALRSGIAA